MPAWIVSLFFPNHFYGCVSPCNFIAQVAGHENSVQLMFAAIGEGLNCSVGHSRRLAVVGARQLMVNHLY